VRLYAAGATESEIKTLEKAFALDQDLSKDGKTVYKLKFPIRISDQNLIKTILNRYVANTPVKQTNFEKWLNGFSLWWTQALPVITSYQWTAMPAVLSNLLTQIGLPTQGMLGSTENVNEVSQHLPQITNNLPKDIPPNGKWFYLNPGHTAQFEEEIPGFLRELDYIVIDSNGKSQKAAKVNYVRLKVYLSDNPNQRDQLLNVIKNQLDQYGKRGVLELARQAYKNKDYATAKVFASNELIKLPFVKDQITVVRKLFESNIPDTVGLKKSIEISAQSFSAGYEQLLNNIISETNTLLPVPQWIIDILRKDTVNIKNLEVFDISKVGDEEKKLLFPDLTQLTDGEIVKLAGYVNCKSNYRRFIYSAFSP
jgi:hypothetical protein